MENELARNVISSALSLIFLGVVVFFTVLSLFLNYHWTRFEITAEHARKVKKIFFGVSSVLILVMLAVGLIYIF